MDLIEIFERLSVLSGDQDRFEIERENILIEAWAAQPPERLGAWIEFQGELNRLRQQMPPGEFINELFRRIVDNAENIDDQFRALRALLDSCQPDQPRLRELNSLAKRA